MWPDFQFAVKRAWASGVLDANDTAVIFYDQDKLDQILSALTKSFAGRQSVAIKTCPIPAVLKHIASKGFALEAASIEEVRLAKSNLVGAQHIIFDSPVKTRREIQEVANDPNMLLNCNSFEELNRIPDGVQCQIGLRVNPLVELNNAAGFNVSTAQSKFGVPISQRSQIVESFIKHNWLTALHMHIGSGVGAIQKHVQAVKKLVDLAHEINSARFKKGLVPLRQLDIGGGLKSLGQTKKNVELVERYAQTLKHIDGIDAFQLITEFGQLIHDPNGFVFTQVEYVRSVGELQQVFIHVGADLFVRNAYSKLGNNLSFMVLNASGEQVKTSLKKTQLVGPLCFAGDELEKSIELPEMTEEQFLLISNAVANTYGLWSRHCSRDVPKVLVYSNLKDALHLAQAREQVW